MFSFDAPNSTLNFLTAYFAGENEAANLCIFEVKAGDFISPGMRLGELVFNGGKRVVMITPDGCAGKIAAVNGAFDYEFLHEPPVQFVLRLVVAETPPLRRPLDPNPFT
ncbi:MAG TPA: hypothetical protein VGK73_37925 [Polyangiaceae bacterium]